MAERFFGSVDSVGSRIELERYLDDIQFAKDVSADHLRKLSAQVDSARRVAELASQQSRLNASAPATSAAAAVVDSAHRTTAEIRTKIDEVLQLYERCRDAKNMVDQTIELRDCLQGCHAAIDARDWERAALLASRARAVPHDVAVSSFARKMVPSTEFPEEPVQNLQAVCDDLGKLFLREFDRAAAERAMDQVSFYFKLFPLVGHADWGLESYAKFIGRTVAGLARTVLQSASTKMRSNLSFYSAVLTNLFENIAAIVKQHTPIVSRHYGPAAMAQSVMPIVQREVDKQAGLIIDTFWDERRMPALISTVKSYGYPGLASAFVSSATNTVSEEVDDSVEDLQEASARLNEIATMLNRWKLYKTFITQGDATANLQEVIDCGTTSDKVNALLGPTCTSLSLFVFRRSVERAVKMDELPSKQAINENAVFSVETPLVSSIVEDVMFVFNQVLMDIVECGHDATTTAAVVGLRRVLESDLVATLQRKLQNVTPHELLPRGDFGGAGVFMIYLDDLELLCQYVGEAVARASAANESVGPQLEQLKRGFVNLATELLHDGARNLAAKRVTPQAQQLVTHHFKAENYTLPASETPFSTTSSAVQEWRQLLAPLRQLLHPQIVVRILDIVSRSLSVTLEKFVWSLQQRLTEAGALLLDKDLSQCIGTICSLNYSLRRRFGKISQMATALVDETADIDLLSAEEQTRIAQMQRAIRRI